MARRGVSLGHLRETPVTFFLWPLGTPQHEATGHLGPPEPLPQPGEGQYLKGPHTNEQRKRVEIFEDGR